MRQSDVTCNIYENWECVPIQALSEARHRAERAAAMAAAAEKALAGLETGIPKARMEAAAQRAKADDLAARLGSLRAATQVRHR